LVDGFDVNEKGENADDWDAQVIELSHKLPSKISEIMSIEVESLS
jgi:hypothetical protein